MSQLLKCPFSRWARRYIQMHYPPGAMLQKDEYIENPKRRCYDNKKVTSQNYPSMILQKSGPALIAAMPA